MSSSCTQNMFVENIMTEPFMCGQSIQTIKTGQGIYQKDTEKRPGRFNRCMYQATGHTIQYKDYTYSLGEFKKMVLTNLIRILYTALVPAGTHECFVMVSSCVSTESLIMLIILLVQN